MFNPFTEVVDGDTADIDLVEQARNGDRASLEKLVLRHQARIYNIAVRMVFQPQDADQVNWLRQMLESQEVRAALHLN